MTQQLHPKTGKSLKDMMVRWFTEKV